MQLGVYCRFEVLRVLWKTPEKSGNLGKAREIPNLNGKNMGFPRKSPVPPKDKFFN